MLELLIVIAILGILLSVGFVFYQRALQNARDQTRISDLSNIKIALEQYFADDNFAYPTSDTNGIINDAICPGSPLDWGSDPLTCGGFTYMKVLPGDPTASPQYCYDSATGAAFNLYANMENANNANISTAVSPAGCPGSNTYNYQLENEM